MQDHKIPVTTTNTSLNTTSTSIIQSSKTTPSTPASGKGRKDEKQAIISSSVVVVEPNRKSSINLNKLVRQPTIAEVHHNAEKLPHLFKNEQEPKSKLMLSIEQNDRDFEKKISGLFSSLDITIKKINKVLL